jgi:hypothetical protein
MDILIVNFDQDLLNSVVETETNLFKSSTKPVFVMDENGQILAGECFVQ